jgi:hypothetical protein
MCVRADWLGYAVDSGLALEISVEGATATGNEWSALFCVEDAMNEIGGVCVSHARNIHSPVSIRHAVLSRAVIIPAPSLRDTSIPVPGLPIGTLCLRRV